MRRDDPKYLVGEVHKGIKDREGLEFMAPLVKSSADYILDSRRFRLLWEYHFAYQRYVLTIDEKLGSLVDVEYFKRLSAAWGMAFSGLFSYVSYKRERVLVGIADGGEMWAPMPDCLVDENEQADWAFFIYCAQQVAEVLGGTGRQEMYDRLMLPAHDRWPTVAAWTPDGKGTLVQKLQVLDRRLSKALGYDSPVTQDDYETILARAVLDRRYELFEGRPALIQLQDNPVVDRVILMQKGNEILAKIETLGEYGDFHISINLVTGDFDRCMPLIIASMHGAPPVWSFQALIAQLYYDLITVEVLDRSPRKYSHHLTARKKIKEVEEKSSSNTLSWIVIPRKEYLRVARSDETVIERRSLTSDEEDRIARIRRYHTVIGHVRKLHEGWEPSEARLDDAREHGIFLREGETYVRPHARGLGDDSPLDVTDIPHFLRRKV